MILQMLFSKLDHFRTVGPTLLYRDTVKYDNIRCHPVAVIIFVEKTIDIDVCFISEIFILFYMFQQKFIQSR